MRLALVHDFLVQHGGAEEVLKVFHDVWPEAPIYTLVHDPKKLGSLFSSADLSAGLSAKALASAEALAKADVRPSFIQRMPFGKRKYQWFLPLMPTAIERHDLMGYDVVLSSSSAFAKGVITSPETLHISYCHTPTRYLWTDTHRYMHERGTMPPLRLLMHPLLTVLRLWDRHAADRADYFIANSKNVQSRIQKYYRRNSDVIHPPVNTKNFQFPISNFQNNQSNYFLAGGRLVAYKRFDLIVRVFNRLGIPLKVFGTGPACAALKKEAKPNIEFLGFVDQGARAELYRHCTAFIHPQEEDFGLTVIEAMASGRPVIAYAKGGALETIKEGETGILFHEQIWEALADAVLRFDATQFDPQKIRTHALQWDVEQFKTKIKQYVDDKWKQFQNSKL
ncbi:glycosyltransferase [Candidatus Uhrbacteria bacterium]|nr:glycosyltransferase [Candidatus Uhrbacteria bacterium]